MSFNVIYAATLLVFLGLKIFASSFSTQNFQPDDEVVILNIIVTKVGKILQDSTRNTDCLKNQPYLICSENHVW